MKISINWLKDSIDLDLTVPELVDILEGIGLMIESREDMGGDTILDLETYANRPDTLGHLGIARELSVKLEQPLKEMNWPVFEIGTMTEECVDVQIRDEELCSRYCGLIVKDVKIGPSPDWLSRRIRAMGLNPVNNVVDVSNYVLFATAQPIHTFDLAKVEGGKIIVRKAAKGEEFQSLDGSAIVLSPDMLVIADEKKPVALAGVIGGENSAVSDSTTDIFIESAHFDPVSIRKTAKMLGIQTDASYRFERNTDISFAPQAAVMAASLLNKFGGKTTKGLIDVFPRPPKKKSVVLRHHRITELLGVEIEEEFITRTLSLLGFQVGQKQPKIWEIKVPAHRIDIGREADVIEEVARFYGYDKIPATIPPLRKLDLSFNPEKPRVTELRQLMFHEGYDEVVNFSFQDPEKESVLQSGRTAVEIRNPISTKASLLRTTLIGGLLENIAWNRNRGSEGVHIFEEGKIYFRGEESYSEELSLAFMATGFIGLDHWDEKRKEANFFHLKGTYEALMNQLGYDSFSFKPGNSGFFDPGKSMSLVLKGQQIGSMGLVKEMILDAYSIKGAVWAAELNLSRLFAKQRKEFRYIPVGRFPSVSRDISLIMDQNVSYQDVKQAIQRRPIPYLEFFGLKDRFAGPPIPEGKVSLSFRFIFRHPGKTLLAKEADSYLKQIIHVLETGFDFQMREGGSN